MLTYEKKTPDLMKIVDNTGKVAFIRTVVKEDTARVIQDSPSAEDDFSSLYTDVTGSSVVCIEPPYNPSTLLDLVTRNNVLGQCIDAMELNIDGTDIEIVDLDKDTKTSEKDKKALMAFFDEVFPGKSFISVRRTLRRQLESIGWSFLEILRNSNGDVVGLRNIRAQNVRLVRLDQPVKVTKFVIRGGKEVPVTYMERQRRYLYKTGTFSLYYKDFGVERRLDKKTGKWEEEGKIVSDDVNATELLMFKINEDTDTEYGVPRWINNIPSVLGSRKAEEYNLKFFDSGGIPPAVVFLEGGALAEDVMKQLKAYFNSDDSANRVAVVSVQSTSGSLNTVGNVKVNVEKFGDTASKDALWQNYDKNAEEHVRVAFRLPPLFVGRAQDYSFATAMTSFMVTEAQVFSPERDEFDDIVNKNIVKALGYKGIGIKSKDITLKNVDMLLKLLELSRDKVTGEDFIKEVNKLGNFEFKELTSEPSVPPVQQQSGVVIEQQQAGEPTPSKQGQPKLSLVGKVEMDKISNLFKKWLVAMKLEDGEVDTVQLEQEMGALTDDEKELLDKLVVKKLYYPDEGLEDYLCSCGV